MRVKEESVIFDRLAARPGPDLLNDIESIFFASASKEYFNSEDERTRFLQTWLSPYVRLMARDTHIALTGTGNVIGYLTGCLDSAAFCPAFQNVDYYGKLLSLYEVYPAHFHINVDVPHRGRGLGEELVFRFLEACTNTSVSGVHVVTMKGARNLRFYLKCGFEPVTELISLNKTLVMLGRKL